MEVGVAAAPGSSSAGLGVGAVGGALEAVAVGAGLAGIQEEAGVRREVSGPESDPDAPPKKRVRLQEGARQGNWRRDCIPYSAAPCA